MEDDLTDVGLNALEELEAQDAEENTEAEDNTEAEEKDTNETEDNTPEDNGEEEDEPNTDGNSDEEDANGEDGSDKNEDSEDNKTTDKKEMTDEEFEEMAKKRGYAKTPTEDDKKKEQDKADRLAELTACPDEVDEKVWAQLPEENKVVYNALPYLNAEGKNGVVKVKTPEQLPEDFEFASKRAEAKFYTDLQAQENKADQLMSAIQTRKERAEQFDAQRAEARNVISQIEALQKGGDLPTPKAKQDAPEFNSDPAVVLINKVLNYRASRMAEGVNLTIKDSLMLYKAQHPEDFEKKEAKGDIERANIAKKVAGNSKSTATAVNKTNKPEYYRIGMSTEDVLDRVLDDMD